MTCTRMRYWWRCAGLRPFALWSRSARGWEYITAEDVNTTIADLEILRLIQMRGDASQ